MNAKTKTDEFSSVTSLVISPNLQALLEFDDLLRASNEGQEKRKEAASANREQHGRYPSWGSQEVPTISLPPPRRKKGVAAGGPVPQKTIPHVRSASSPANTPFGVRESGGHEEVLFEKSDDIPEEPKDLNPYLNSPPSPPRYFYPREDEEGNGQPSPLYTLERTRSIPRTKRQRSSSDRSRGSQSVSPRLAERNGGLQTKERASGPRAAATRPLLLHRHKTSRSSAHSYQTVTSYEPSSSPEPRVSISSTIYSASTASLPISFSHSHTPSSVQGSFIDLGSPPMSPSESDSHESTFAKPSSANHSPRHSNPNSRPASPLPKPPIPTTPKPVFNRPHLSRKSADGRPKIEDPPITTLSAAERAELVKKTRKITQLLGQTPGPDLTSLSQLAASSQRSLPDVRKGHRVFASISNPLHPSDKGVWPPPDETVYLNINGRRHSTPLSPTTSWGLDEDDSVLVLDRDERLPFSTSPSRAQTSPRSPLPSPASFIDLSEDDSAAETPKDVTDYRRQAPFSRENTIDDTSSLFTLTSTQVHEEERKRMREKLVKLHRFLGSRVPTDLALGLDLGRSTELPPPVSADAVTEDTRKKFRMRRRRSSSFAGYSRLLTAQEDRMKSDLDIQEKALNVRRAAKMEKVFGVAPPQTLYHTRKPDSPRPLSLGPASTSTLNIDAPPSIIPLDPLSFFIAQGFGQKGKKPRRSATPDSSRALISRTDTNNSIDIYTNYQASLNSLIEIVDNDDTISLKAIHHILHADDDGTGVRRMVDDDEYDSSESETSPPAITHEERRRSLPLCPSINSLNSEYSITSPPPEISTFELKRRRAAKLTNFFGVSHRDIMNDILESIESGVAEERGRGNLNEAQADDLLQKVWNLKTRT